MSAYVIFAFDKTKDQSEIEEYRRMAGPSVAEHGGKILIRRSPVDTVEGAWSPDTVVLLEFDSMEIVRAWYNSAAYQSAIAVRQRGADAVVSFIEGA